MKRCQLHMLEPQTETGVKCLTSHVSCILLTQIIECPRISDILVTTTRSVMNVAASPTFCLDAGDNHDSRSSWYIGEVRIRRGCSVVVGSLG